MIFKTAIRYIAGHGRLWDKIIKLLSLHPWCRMIWLNLRKQLISPVVDDERLEATSRLRFDPVLENEAQDSAGHLEEPVFAFCLEVELYIMVHLQEKENGEKDGIGRQ